MWGSYGAGSQCVGVAVYGNCNVWGLHWTSCSEKKIVKVFSVRDALCGSCGLQAWGCEGVAVCISCGVWELQCGGVVVCDSYIVRKLYCGGHVGY